MSEGARPRVTVRPPSVDGGATVLVWAPGAVSFTPAVASGDGSVEAEVGSIIALAAGGTSPVYYLVSEAGLEELRCPRP